MNAKDQRLLSHIILLVVALWFVTVLVLVRALYA